MHDCKGEEKDAVFEDKGRVKFLPEGFARDDSTTEKFGMENSHQLSGREHQAYRIECKF